MVKWGMVEDFIVEFSLLEAVFILFSEFVVVLVVRGGVVLVETLNIKNNLFLSKILNKSATRCR